MARKVFGEWISESELLQIIHIKPRVLQDLRRLKKIPFKKATQKNYLYNVEDVLAALPEFNCTGESK
jgi:hypothetical protein